jgi:hypothetical protein
MTSTSQAQTALIGLYWADDTTSVVMSVDGKKTVREAVKDSVPELFKKVCNKYGYPNPSETDEKVDVFMNFCPSEVESSADDIKVETLPSRSARTGEVVTAIIRADLDPPPMMSRVLKLQDENAALRISLADELANNDSPAPVSKKKQKKAMTVAAGDVSKQLASMMEEIQKLQKGREQDRVRADEDRAEDRARIFTLENANARLEANAKESASSIAELTRLTAMIAPLHLRVLLDQARLKIVTSCKCQSWEDLRGARRLLELKQHIVSQLDLPMDLTSFVCEFNNVRDKGNRAAHVASATDVRNAVVQQRLGSADRKLLEQLFEFVYGQKID